MSPPKFFISSARLGVCAVAIAGSLCLGAPLAQAQHAGATEPAALREQRGQVERLSQERRQTAQQLARIQANEDELHLEIEKLAELVRTSLRRKDTLEARIRAESAQVAQQERELKHLEREIRASERRIGRRLLRLYRMAKQGHSAMLFQMARYETFAKDSHYLALLQDADRDAIRRFEEMNRELAVGKRQTELSVKRLEALRDELDQETQQLSEREQYLRQSMSDVAKNRTLYSKYLKDVERMMAGMEAAVARMEREAKARPAPPKPKTPAELRGTLPAPVAGSVLAAFGAQDPRYDLKKLQRGILLRVEPNAPVAAISRGRAVHAGPFRGYQSLVVLDHGDGLFSVYGHLEALTVKRGDWVVQGKVLGRASYQPVDESYDVYFEIRHNGQPDDPLGWLAPGVLQAADTEAAN